MKPSKYELISCEINTHKFYFNGIKIDTKQEIKRITHSADYDPIGYITGDKTVDFTFTDPKDAQMLEMLYSTWTTTHTPFNMIIYAKNVDTNGWDIVATLDGCVLNKIDHNIKSKEEWKPGAGGMALKYSRVNYQFDPDTGTLLSPAKDALSSVNTTLSKGKSIISEAERVGRTVGIV